MNYRGRLDYFTISENVETFTGLITQAIQNCYDVLVLERAIILHLMTTSRKRFDHIQVYEAVMEQYGYESHRLVVHYVAS